MKVLFALFILLLVSVYAPVQAQASMACINLQGPMVWFGVQPMPFRPNRWRWLDVSRVEPLFWALNGRNIWNSATQNWENADKTDRHGDYVYWLYAYGAGHTDDPRMISVITNVLNASEYYVLAYDHNIMAGGVQHPCIAIAVPRAAILNLIRLERP